VLPPKPSRSAGEHLPAAALRRAHRATRPIRIARISARSPPGSDRQITLHAGGFGWGRTGGRRRVSCAVPWSRPRRWAERQVRPVRPVRLAHGVPMPAHAGSRHPPMHHCVCALLGSDPVSGALLGVQARGARANRTEGFRREDADEQGALPPANIVRRFVRAPAKWHTVHQPDRPARAALPCGLRSYLLSNLPAGRRPHGLPSPIPPPSQIPDAGRYSPRF
jgi:hypothetical protein